jgi:sugar phosphate isomerase/epimerase
MKRLSITMLNSMADPDFEIALDRHVKWGLRHLDLKDSIFGKGVIDLSDAEARRAAALIAARGLSVYCMSTQLFHGDVEVGEPAFRQAHLEPLERAIAVAGILRPSLFRLLSARTTRREQLTDSIAYLRREHPWVIACYREAIQRLAAAGLRVTIENECHANIFSSPAEVTDFFAELDCGAAVNLTWDVQNMWQMGTVPSLDAYRQLRPLLAYFHLKGGQSAPGTKLLRWRSSLEDASWPVTEITRQVVADGSSPVICLNASHGERREGHDYHEVLERDLAFVRREIGGGDR